MIRFGEFRSGSGDDVLVPLLSGRHGLFGNCTCGVLVYGLGELSCGNGGNVLVRLPGRLRANGCGSGVLVLGACKLCGGCCHYVLMLRYSGNGGNILVHLLGQRHVLFGSGDCGILVCGYGKLCSGNDGRVVNRLPGRLCIHGRNSGVLVLGVCKDLVRRPG
mmetsp:Transcript_30484/g.76634  ORF Transcript_30484/g.76634 Transcript_30484/m.76634 type:complete len:162 (+) Transcript_30484:556-1041(+)